MFDRWLNDYWATRQKSNLHWGVIVVMCMSLPPTSQVALKPNIYYELTDGVQVTLANITCYYLIGNGPEEAANDEREGSSSMLQ